MCTGWPWRRCSPATVVRPPGRKAGTSKVASKGPSSACSSSLSRGKWPRRVESPRLSSSQRSITPAWRAAANAAVSALQICRTRSAASGAARPRLLASKNSSGEGWARPAARAWGVQRSSSGQLCTVWEPVGSSSSTMILSRSGGVAGWAWLGAPCSASGPVCRCAANCLSLPHGTIVP